jgi:hypothetical protein
MSHNSAALKLEDIWTTFFMSLIGERPFADAAGEFYQNGGLETTIPIEAADKPKSSGNRSNLSVLKQGHARAIRFSTLEGICEALDCQPGDLLSYRKKGESG